MDDDFETASNAVRPRASGDELPELERAAPLQRAAPFSVLRRFCLKIPSTWGLLLLVKETLARPLQLGQRAHRLSCNELVRHGGERKQ